MYIPKRYGQSKIDKCPFCGKQAIAKNSQEVPVCQEHKDSSLKDLKCACGSYLDMKNGKFGVFFTCINCGIVNMKKALEINEGDLAKEPVYKTQTKTKSISKPANSERKEITVSSDDPMFFD